MNAAEALAFIVTRLQPETDPVLTVDEVTALLPLAATVDSADLTPDEDDWTPTYNTVGCYRAVAEGWGIKRGKAVGRYDFTTDGQMFRRSQLLDQIDHERKRWGAKVQVAMSTLGDVSG